MNAEAMLLWGLIIFMVAIIFGGLYLLNPIGYLLKFLGQFRRNIVFWNGLHRYKIDVPELRLSWYFNRFPVKSYETAGFNPTTDCYVMASIANQLIPHLKGKSKRAKANIILRCVEQSVWYKHDDKRYGTAEKWAFPIATLFYRTGDCEDTAFMYAGLCHLCGLDVKLILLPGHMACAVDIGKKTFSSYNIDGKWYAHAETTGVLPVGIYLGDKGLKRWWNVQAPTPDWKNTTVIDNFDKYE